METHQKKKQKLNREWYSFHSILGNSQAKFHFLIGEREAGKLYAREIVKQLIAERQKREKEE